MKSVFRLVEGVVCIALMMICGSSNVLAQTHVKAAMGGGGLRIQELTGYGPRSLMRSPDASGARGRGGVREWAELKIAYDTDNEWTDEITLQYYTLHFLRASGEYTLLKGAISYVDVARGRGHLGVMYVRPNALARFGEVVGVAVEVSVKGEVVASLSEGKLGPSKPLPAKWWLNPKLTPKEGYIVEKAKTPFALLNFDDYEAVK